MSRYSLLSSVSNRLTGLMLSAGQLLLVYWLMSAAAGPHAYARAAQVLSTPVLKVCYALLLLAFTYHLSAGIRHLLWDSGYGLEREQSRRSAWVIMLLALVLAVVGGYFAFAGRSPA